ncbi:MAG: PIN domain-containing protein [Terriglobales bacterium]
MNGDRFFIDTNVFVYRFDETAPDKAARADAIIRTGVLERRGVVSLQVAQEFCNVVLCKLPRGLAPPDAQAYLESDILPLLAPAEAGALLRQGLSLHQRLHLAWYDALIVAAAQRAGCDVLYSEDFQHGQRFDQVRCVNPFL